jgi:phosphoserine phosphatase
MMGIAGLSVAYHAKPAVQAQAAGVIRFGGLDTVKLWMDV